MLDPPSSALPYILEVLSPSFILFDFNDLKFSKFSYDPVCALSPRKRLEFLLRIPMLTELFDMLLLMLFELKLTLERLVY